MEAKHELLKVKEVAEILRLSNRTIRRMIIDGRLKALRIAGAHPVIPRAELERLIEEARAAS